MKSKLVQKVLAPSQATPKGKTKLLHTGIGSTRGKNKDEQHKTVRLKNKRKIKKSMFNLMWCMSSQSHQRSPATFFVMIH